MAFQLRRELGVTGQPTPDDAVRLTVYIHYGRIRCITEDRLREAVAELSGFDGFLAEVAARIISGSQSRGDEDERHDFAMTFLGAWYAGPMEEWPQAGEGGAA